MWNLSTKCLRRLWLRIYKLGIADALALHRRNEVRSDGLVLKNVCNRLEISWEARGVHPWDEKLLALSKEIEFAEQALEDTEAAVIRIFERLPEIDVLEIRVVVPQTGELLAIGTIPRAAINTEGNNARSVRMRLGELGIRYPIAPTQWENLGQKRTFKRPTRQHHDV
jgi:hypothetical protein